MKKLHVLLILLLLMLVVGCSTQTAPTTSNESPSGVEVDPAVSDFAEDEDEVANPALAPLPSLLGENGYGIGEPLPGGAADPFAAATFQLATELPAGMETAVVEQHNFGQLTAEKARQLADQFGFTGPLYIQLIDPEFAPPAGQEGPTVYTAFNGQRIMNISHTGLTYEDRGVTVDFSQQLSFEEKAPIVEAQLKAWNLLDFPYEIQKLPTGDLVIYRLIDGVPTQQNEFNILLNEAGEVGYFDYHPLREIDGLGNYPLQTAESAWAQLQTAVGRSLIRYQLTTAASTPMPEFVTPRAWGPLTEQGQELHLYLAPMVFEAVDGSGPYVLLNDMALTGDSAEIAEIATHLGDALHLWGTVDRTSGGKNFVLIGWEELETIEYLSLEGTIEYQDGQVLLNTVEDETFILAAAPTDIPEGITVYVGAGGQRDTGAEYPVLDFNLISEQVTYPEVPMDVAEEAAVINQVTIQSVELVHYTMYRDPGDTQTDISFLFVPVWKFSGEANNGQLATFWISAEYLQAPPDPNAVGSISGWVWHDVCQTAKDGEPALTSAPAGCIEAPSALGDYRADGNQDSQEPPIGDLIVRLGEGACPAAGLAEFTTVATDISYSFTDLKPGTYCVSINPSEEPNLSLLRPGIWTFPEVSEETIERTVVLEPGQNLFDVNFGWDHQFRP